MNTTANDVLANRYGVSEYANLFLLNVAGRQHGSVPALDRPLEIAEAAGATTLIPRILSTIAFGAFVREKVEEGFAALERGRALAQAAHDGPAMAWLVGNESDVLLKMGQFGRAAEVASCGFDAARRAGLEAWRVASVLAGNAADALLAMGRTAEAAALIDPLTTRPPDRDNWLVHVLRAEIDLRRGDTDAAAGRWRLINAFPAIIKGIDSAYESVPTAAEASLWAGCPGDALDQVQRALPLVTTPDLTIFYGRLLVAGMRACADLAERARARRDGAGAAAAAAAADGLATWVQQIGGAPFANHLFVAAVPAERASWDAERTRLAGPSEPKAWAVAAKAWQGLGCPHRAAYAWWRQAQAQLDAGQPIAEAAVVLRAATVAADGHVPLLAEIRALAERARIALQLPAAAAPALPAARAPAPYGLTGRELVVLRLLAAGRTNAQIGAELYISPKTAGVHVSNILRKLGASGRVQAAALAERAGLLPSRQP